MQVIAFTKKQDTLLGHNTISLENISLLKLTINLTQAVTIYPGYIFLGIS